jgi:uncharacterized protein (TIGR03437 family)
VDGPAQVLAIAGNGLTAFTSESGPALSQGLNAPAGIVADASGTLYFIDGGNNRVRKLSPVSSSTENPLPPPSATALVSAASLLPGPIAPGQILSIFGHGLGPAAGAASAMPAFELGGTHVLFDGKLAALFYAGEKQINLQVPYSIAAASNVDVQVIHNGVVRARMNVPVAESVPGLFTAEAGTGQAAALNEDGSYNSAQTPAPRGSVVVLFATGEGKTNPNSVEGRPAGYPLPVPVLPVTVRIGGYPADVVYAGAAPGFSGLLQLNVRVPAGFLAPGIQPATVQIGNAVSQPGVTVALK